MLWNFRLLRLQEAPFRGYVTKTPKRRELYRLAWWGPMVSYRMVLPHHVVIEGES